jgi:hypothetical protein
LYPPPDILPELIGRGGGHGGVPVQGIIQILIHLFSQFPNACPEAGLPDTTVLREFQEMIQGDFRREFRLSHPHGQAGTEVRPQRGGDQVIGRCEPTGVVVVEPGKILAMGDNATGDYLTFPL